MTNPTKPSSHQATPGTPGLPWWAPNSTQPLATVSHPQRTPRTILSAVTATVLVLAALGLALAGGTTPATRPTNITGGTEHRQTTQALIGGCGGIYTFTNTISRSGTLPDIASPRAYHYDTTVPVYGPMTETAADTTTTYWASDNPAAPSPRTLLRNQWNGALVAYYTPRADPADIKRLRTIAAENPDYQILIAPWPANWGPLPQGRTIALATWGATQTCAIVNAAAIREFHDMNPPAAAPGYTGTQPPAYGK